jgi:ubiquinone/menaquinone biosynthesis C-methylase UbiE
MRQWNKIYKSEGAGFTSSLGYWSQLVSFLKAKKVNSILDLGCGTGSHMLELAKQGFQVSGFDVSQKGIDIAQQQFNQNNLKADFKVGSMHERLPFSDDFFDAVLSLRTINHGTKRELEYTIGEIYRVVKPNGYLFLTTIKIPGRKKILGLTKLNGLPVEIIAPYTYKPVAGREVGITHFMFNKQSLSEMFRNFQIQNMWVEYGKKHWERYYCMLAQKPRFFELIGHEQFHC